MTGKFKRLVESLGIGERGPPADAGGFGTSACAGKWERGAVSVRPTTTYELNQTGHAE